MDGIDPWAPRFAEGSAKRGRYESVFLAAHHPSEPEAIWIRHTVHAPPGGGAPRASVWFTHFGPSGVRAAKATVAPASHDDAHTVIAGELGRVGPGGSSGELVTDGCSARWDLQFDDVERPMLHLPSPRMYGLPIPRTKALAAIPSLTLAGSVEVDGDPVDVAGWPGSVGHNWGAEHADRWIWLRAGPFDGMDRSWLDVVIGRIKIGPVRTPWLANGMVSIDGTRHRVGGLGRSLRPTVSERPDGARLVLPGADISAEVTVRLALDRCVAWSYRDPSGEAHEVVNCSAADIDVELTGNGQTRTFEGPVGVYEIGAHTAALPVDLQPFDD
jgi:hypothetical protein